MKIRILTRLLFAGAILGGMIVAGCSVTGNNSPPIGVITNPITNLGTLQLAVGAANIGQNANASGTNFVATFRQANGDSAALVNTPTITGPGSVVAGVCSGWCVSAAFANPVPGADGGTNSISGQTQQVAPSPTPSPRTFGQSGGVFGFAIAPANSNTAGGSVTSTTTGVFALFGQPFFSTSSSSTVQIKYYGTPPAYWFFDDGTWPNNQNGGGFRGFSQGFTEVRIAPVSGAYTLSDVVASANAGTATYTATATLTNNTTPPAQTAPVIVTKSGGGLTGTVTIPAATAAFPFVETMVYVRDATSGYFYSAGPIKVTGVQTFTIPGNLGPCFGGAGCQNTSAATATFTTGDTLVLFAATFDYPMFENSSGDGPGAATQISTSMTPTITGSTGQADISTSPASVVSY